MDRKVMSHRGYQGTVEFCLDSKILYGKVLFINDLVTYEAENVEGLQKAFEDSVDEYLAFCAEENIAPDKQASGSFNVRLGPELHMQTLRYGAVKGKSLNEIVREAVNALVNGHLREVHHHHHRVEVTSGFSEEVELRAVSRVGKHEMKMEAVH